MREITIKIHEIATDGLPDMDALTGRVAFIFDGCIVSGWPLAARFNLDRPGYVEPPRWEANGDVGRNIEFAGVTHWAEFPEPLYQIERA